MDKITKTFLYFLIIVALCLTETGCSSSRSSYNQRKSATTGKGYVRKKAKSGNKRANSSRNSRSTVASRSSSSNKPVYGKRPPTSSKPSTTVKESKSASVQVREVIKTARSFIGTPYRYGGSTRKGMDCSGLLCTSFEAANIKLPRTSNEQANYGTEIRVANLSPGDLVFFAERKGSSRISHVGMVTEVNGKNEVKFIHSSSSRGVIEDNFYSDYFQKIFVKAVRPF